MNQQTAILVVEDDTSMQHLLSSYLTAHGYGVSIASTGQEAIDRLMSDPPDLVLLDMGLPDGMSGLDVCRRMRAFDSLPIIVVTALQSPEAAAQALDAGADDYVTKPFDACVLLARVRAAVRRAHAPAFSRFVQLGDLCVDLAAREVRRGGHAIPLTRTEFDLLAALVRSRDRTLAYDEIFGAVWEPGYTELHAVHVHVSRLRTKIERHGGDPQLIASVPGVGYRVCSAPERALAAAA